MAEREGKLQKWQRKTHHEKISDKVLIYPHYHCAVCENSIDSNEVYEKNMVTKKDSYPHMQNFCTKPCYEKIFGGKKKDKPAVPLKDKLKKHFLWIILAAYGGIMALVILVLWLMSMA